MAAVALEPASRRSHAELAEIFNAGYEGYFTPFNLDEAAFRFMTTVYDDDFEASRVALVDGAPVGICKLAVRGDRGWIAGIGVATAHRGRGVGEALMHDVLATARDRGLREVWLEVLVQNEPAIRLYEKLGFDRVRGLEVWELDGAPGTGADAPLDEAHAWIREHRVAREPWQRADETVENLRRLEPAPRGLAVDGGAAIVRVDAGRASIVQLAAATADAARSLLEAARGLAAKLTWLNLPDDDPTSPVVAAIGGRILLRQHELVLTL